MPAPTPPAARRGLFARLWDRIRTTRLWVKWTVSAVVLGLVAGGAIGVLGWRKLEQRQRGEQTSEQWARFEKAVKAGDEGEMRAALDAVFALSADPICDRYRETLDTGIAPSDDPRLCLLSTTLHARHGRWPDAAREATKRLVLHPDDWNARCVVALAAVSAGDLATARAEVERLPDPADAPVSPMGLVLAFDLFCATGRDTTPIRRFVNDVVVDVLGSVGVEKDPPSVKIDLVQCYLIGFAGPSGEPLPVRLGRAAAAVGKLADDAAASDDPVLLTRLGTACNRLFTAYDRLHRGGQITEEQRVGFVLEHQARTTRVWQRVKELSPKTSAAYHGLALVELRARRSDAAITEVRAGLDACGNAPPLLALYSMLLKSTNRITDALRTLATAADADPNNLNLLLLLAELALDAPRRDVADVALRRAAVIAPADLRVIRIDLRLKLESGDSHAALQRLRDLGDAVILSEPLLARVYGRTLTDAGLGVLLPGWLKKVEEKAAATGSPLVLASAVRGLADGHFDSETAPPALAVIDRALARWPIDADCLVARAAFLARWAENGRPRWEPARTREAAFALERLRGLAPDDPVAATALARVRLFGLNEPAQSLKDVGPLLDLREREGLLTADQLTLLGAVLLANEKIEPAMAALEAAHKLAPDSATTCLHLARVYHACGENIRGRELVAAARRLPRTPQDDADLLALPATLRENP
ncbi:MAG: hypothetical protein MUF18_15380 [Fimbriiglobus sp.]|nr:hypothetical protein [Fimbriiglobus sp.]